MGNVWGVDEATPDKVRLGPGSNVVCNAGILTTVLTFPPIAPPQPGSYVPNVMGTIAISLGATPPTAINVAAQVNGGSNLDSMNVTPGLLVANAIFMLPIILIGTASGTAWAGAGGVITLTLTATSQNATVLNNGTAVTVRLSRGANTNP